MPYCKDPPFLLSVEEWFLEEAFAGGPIEVDLLEGQQGLARNSGYSSISPTEGLKIPCIGVFSCSVCSECITPMGLYTISLPFQ